MKAIEIKHALLSYFRFTRQCICATECLNNDVMGITKNNIIFEVEVKINKYDLWKGEAKKDKHKFKYNKGDYYTFVPNRFYLCVPPELREEGEKWVQATNKKYGLLLCRKHDSYPYIINVLRSAKLLHKNSAHIDRWKDAIMKRVCSENINLILKTLLR